MGNRRTEGRRTHAYRAPYAKQVHKLELELEPVDDFTAAVRAMLDSPRFAAVLGEYERHNVSCWFKVRGWVEFILERCSAGKAPSMKQRELCNHYLAKSGAKGVRCLSEPVYFGKGADDRAIQSHLSGLMWLRRKLARERSVA